ANDLSFIVNGKVDGAARGDAATQVMAGMIGAMLHPQPRTSLVIGLGTGSSAGWLGLIPSMERVDVVELEPVVLEVARQCEAVNGGAMSNPRIHIQIADAREVLLATPRSYDVIASEPSNPYRAGIASLFTKEFYEAAASRLNRNGILVQWMQMYAIDSSTARTIYATMTAVFPHVETWWTTRGDAVLLASREPIVHDVDRLRGLLRTEPYRTAVGKAWRVHTAEGFMAHMAANEEFALRAAAEATDLNTDDRPVIEFGFARSLDASANALLQLIATSERLGTVFPRTMRGRLDPTAVAAHRRIGLPGQENVVSPVNSYDLALRAMYLARRGDPAAEPMAAALREIEPAEGEMVLAELRHKQGRHAEAARHLRQAFVEMHRSPWALPEIARNSLDTAIAVAQQEPASAGLLLEQLKTPFSTYQQDNFRRYARIVIARQAHGCGAETLAALRDGEPNPMWSADVLSLRASCYRQAGLLDLAERADDDLASFLSSQTMPLVTRAAPAAPR
ncbi:MAG: fused MFS/spermidine synthase, partial [Thermoanaerobaculia bacterium]